MSTKKGLDPISYNSGGAIGINEPVKMGTSDNTVIVPTATSDVVVGIAQLDATTAGQPVPIQSKPGAVVIMRCGSGGVSGGDSVGLDGTDKTEIATLTLNPAGTSSRQRLGVVDAASTTSFTNNQEVPVRLTLDIVLV